MNVHTAGGRAGRLLLAGRAPRYSWRRGAVLVSSLWPCLNRKQGVLGQQEGATCVQGRGQSPSGERLPHQRSTQHSPLCLPTVPLRPLCSPRTPGAGRASPGSTAWCRGTAGCAWSCCLLAPRPAALPRHLREELQGCWRCAVPFVSWLRDSPKDGAAPRQKGAGGTQRVSSQGASRRRAGCCELVPKYWCF